MGKFFAFVLGLLVGIAATVFVGDQMGVIDPVRSSEADALAYRIELLTGDDICALLAKEVISRDDHVMSWTDGKSYLIAGWIVQKSGVPYFRWTGAGLPDGRPCPK